MLFKKLKISSNIKFIRKLEYTNMKCHDVCSKWKDCEDEIIYGEITLNDVCWKCNKNTACYIPEKYYVSKEEKI